MEKEYKMSAARAQELQEELNYLHGIISEESPFGKALLGAKEGDTVTVEAPQGAITYTVQKIER